MPRLIVPSRGGGTKLMRTLRTIGDGEGVAAGAVEGTSEGVVDAVAEGVGEIVSEGTAGVVGISWALTSPNEQAIRITMQTAVASSAVEGFRLATIKAAWRDVSASLDMTREIKGNSASLSSGRDYRAVRNRKEKLRPFGS
jgi:hypothetical protein